ncbi:MAG: hypothetical protein ACLUGB_01890 [Bacilli bacterium]|jgi:hypothetical protein
MKLEVGMYIRTKYCGICDEIAIRKIIKIDKINNNWFYIDKNVCDIYKDYTNKLNTVNVEKASFNIIDILEVGDYVNGYYVEDVLKTFVNVAVGSNYFQSPTIYEKDIKSIVTKEQFENMKYGIAKK